MRRAVVLLDRFEEILISVFLASATLISFLQVVLRYAFSSSITWATEATTFLLIWTALIGASYAARRKIHIGVDTLVNLLPERFYRVSVIAAALISIVYTVTLCILGIEFIKFMRTIGQVSPDLEWPMWIIFLAVPLGSAMMTFRFCQQVYSDIFIKPPARHAHGAGEIPPMIRLAQEEAKKREDAL